MVLSGALELRPFLRKVRKFSCFLSSGVQPLVVRFRQHVWDEFELGRASDGVEERLALIDLLLGWFGPRKVNNYFAFS